MWDPTPENWFNGATGVFLALLGIGIATIRPRRPANIALAVLLFGFGGGFAFGNANIALTGNTAGNWLLLLLYIICTLIATAGAVAFAFLFPNRWRPTLRTVLPLTLFTIVQVVILAVAMFENPYLSRDIVDNYALTQVFGITFFVMIYAVMFAIGVFAIRRLDAPSMDRVALSWAVIGLFPYIALTLVGLWALVGQQWGQNLPWTQLSRTAGVVFLLVPAGITLVAMARRRVASDRVVLLAIVGLTGIAALLALAPSYQSVDRTGYMSGVARVMMGALLAFAVLRGQILGLEMKAKWTIRQSTLAAIAIAIFFVVSETAQQFFGDRAGNQYMGIAAAGILVLGMAPLQRLADRVASSALPGVVPVVDMSRGERAATYGRVVAAAWADGVLSHDERSLLARMRVDLDLTEVEATTIEDLYFASQSPNTPSGVAPS